MHAASTLEAALALRDDGLGARRIARQLDLPVATVRDWLAGRLPRNVHGDGSRRGCESCGYGDHHRFSELPSVYVYLLGLYLGDGCLSAHRRNVYKLRIVLDVRYPGIIESTASAVHKVRGKAASIRKHPVHNYVEVYSYWKQWPCYFPQHGAGPKHARHIALTDWQEELVERWPEQLLRGLIQSDGCRYMNTGRGWAWPRYSFSQVSTDIQQIFCSACDRLGLRWTRSGSRTINISRKADVATLDTFIGPKR